MGIGLYIIIGILFVASLVLTMYAFRKIDNEIKDHEINESTVEDEIKRSHEFETGSVRKYLPVQIWLYVITIGGSLIAFGIYFYLKG